jgi:hypothetical protein
MSGSVMLIRPADRRPTQATVIPVAPYILMVRMKRSTDRTSPEQSP